MKRIGITLRLSSPQGYDEPRDSLAREWYRFLAALGCGHQWILLPNLGLDTVAYAKEHNVEALILTGGDDLGNDPVRDDSELALLKYAIEVQLPVLGICRGLQLMHVFFGGLLADADRRTHVAGRHQLIACRDQPTLPWQDDVVQGRSVNSFHGRQLAHPVPTPLVPWACDEAGICEAVVHADKKIAGVMWHPERETVISQSDQRLCRWLFE
ncbi:MAG TPA: gamma-glutamyl-gamma-aminobutyrate hydrolase family protein [Herbaspirillum sp.]|jgi:putative glutamine amidotransferase